MENSNYYSTKSINFIKILNIILIGFLIIVVSLIFILEINDTVNFKSGHIYSHSPQIKINAPNEVKVLKVLIREGQEVKKGDTLFLFENRKIKSDFDVTNSNINAMENKIEIINKLIANTFERKNALNQLLSIQTNIYKTDQKKTKKEIASLNNKIKLSSQQSTILTNKYNVDSLLYAKGAISRYDLFETKSKNIEDKKGQADINANYDNMNFDFENIANNYQKTNNDLKRSIIDVDNQIENYKRDILELKNLIEDSKYNLNYISDELNQLVITAPIDGTISNLYNAVQNQEIVNKGDVLTIIAPKKETFYAKIVLDEKDLCYVKKGQEINLKMDAYNYYMYGPIKGIITYVSPSEVDKTFYCLADIKKYNSHIFLKAGYSLKGEVILEKMRIFQYIIKKLFNKVGDNFN